MNNVSKRVKWFLFVVMLFGGGLSAQMVQYGRVVEMNTGGKALSGVSISLNSTHDCQPTSSDANGVFRLSFGEHQVGDVVRGLRVRKYGYELVNHHIARDGWTLTDKDTLRVVMAPIGKIAEARSRYYDLLEEACVRRYDSTLSFLNEQYAHQILSPMEYEYWKTQAKTEFDDAYMNLSEYSDRLARIDDDDKDVTSRQILTQIVNHDMLNVLALVADEQSVLETYIGFSRNYPMEEPEEYVADVVYDTLNIPDTLYSDMNVLKTYTQGFENNFLTEGLRYSKSCLYLGMLFKEIGYKSIAEMYFRKALHTYEMLNEMEGCDYQEQIAKLKAIIESMK